MMAKTAAEQKPLPQFDKSQLAQLFGLHRNTVAARLREVAPDGQRRGRGRNSALDTWTLITAAAHLCDRSKLLAGYGEDPDNLPPEDAKNYWDAKLKEQTYLHRDGHLWSDEEVLEVFSGIFKPLANKVRAISDTLERRAGLTARQTGVVDEVCDEMLREMHDMVAAVAGEPVEVAS